MKLLQGWRGMCAQILEQKESKLIQPQLFGQVFLRTVWYLAPMEITVISQHTHCFMPSMQSTKSSNISKRDWGRNKALITSGSGSFREQRRIPVCSNKCLANFAESWSVWLRLTSSIKTELLNVWTEFLLRLSARDVTTRSCWKQIWREALTMAVYV